MGRRPRSGPDFEAVRTAIGIGLRSVYFDELNEPLPEKMVTLLGQLDERLRQLHQQKDADRT